jgi:hypothetical protein
MKKVVRLNFRKWKIVKISGAYYINSFVEKSNIVKIDGERYYKIKKSKLRNLGMKFPSLKKNVLEEGERVDSEFAFSAPEYLESAA